MRGALPAVEAVLFSHRGWVLAFFGAITGILGWFCLGTRIEASFAKQLPREHPYIQTFLQHRDQVGGANRVLIALLPREGDIFTPSFFQTLKACTDAVFFLPGVDRSQVQSLFTPNVRYLAVDSAGFTGGPVIPPGFEPDAAGFAQVRDNIIKSGKLGSLVASDFRGALISATLLDRDPSSGETIDPAVVAAALERGVREPFETPELTVAIIGFAKVIGDVKAGAAGVLQFFGVSFVLTTALLWLYASSFRLIWPSLVCALIAVVWQMGAMTACGYGLDPYSLLVPFLIFAIGVSHAVQMLRAYRAEIFAGAEGVAAARAAFRQLALPGGVALLSDTVGFLTLLVIKIEVIEELALSASLGVAALLLINLILLPVLLSYQPLPASYRQHIICRREHTDRSWRRALDLLRGPGTAAILAVSAGLGGLAYWKSQDVRIGDSQPGVPELRADHRYNQDSRRIAAHFSLGVDVLAVVAETHPDGCVDGRVLETLAQLEFELRRLQGVRSVVSLASVAREVNRAWNEGSLKWRLLPPHPQALAQAVAPVETATGLLNADGSVLPVFIFLTDHKAETLQAVTQAVKGFSSRLAPEIPVRLRLAGGNAGVMAATNEVVAAAQFPILAWVFGVVTVLCALTFRSVRATLAIMLPLALVSGLAYALMAWAGIGLKIATLPVVALGAGIGVDYGIYLFARFAEAQDRGLGRDEALYGALTQAGSSVVFTALTLGLGVGLWVFSDLQFQADMGLLLAFLFGVNMIGAVILMPALVVALYPASAGKTTGWRFWDWRNRQKE